MSPMHFGTNWPGIPKDALNALGRFTTLLCPPKDHSRSGRIRRKEWGELNPS